jgi:hypothetical protein
VEHVNLTLVATDLSIGVMATFPIFCQCSAASDNVTTTLVTYVKPLGDTDAQGEASHDDYRGQYALCNGVYNTNKQ